jgi:hypothetical protein
MSILESCMKLPMLIVVLVCQVVPLDEDEQRERQEQREAVRTQRAKLAEQFTRLMAAVQELGSWEEHSAYALAATEKIFERNGWDSEPDLFSLDLIREVEALPPWAIQDRFDTFVGALSDRYLLDERQEQILQQTIARESNAVFARHAGRILEYAGEMIQTRAAGEAITPEQVARWVELATPVFEDSQRALNEGAQQFMQKLDPEQQAIVQRDVDAANRRMGRIEELSGRWARGEWHPSDWGIEDDPIQLAGEARAAQETDQPDEAAAAVGRATGDRGDVSGAPPQPPPTAPRPPGARDRPVARARTSQPADRSRNQPEARGTVKGADDRWARYVRAFIRKYRLDDAQQQRAWMIYRDVKARGDRLDKRHAGQVALLQHRLAKAADEKTQAALQKQITRHNADLARLFRQLKKRLERLPTSAQRRNAVPGEIASPLPPAADPHPSDGP